MSIAWDFTDRTVLVTGGAQGIGAELVRFFSAARARVIAVDLDAAHLADAHGGDEHVVPVVADIADSAAVARIFETAQDNGTAPDIVVNNAGITRDAMAWKLTDDQWKAVLDVHLTATFLLTRAAVPRCGRRVSDASST